MKVKLFMSNIEDMMKTFRILFYIFVIDVLILFPPIDKRSPEGSMKLPEFLAEERRRLAVSHLNLFVFYII